MKILDLMKTYCLNLFNSNKPETMAMYQALLPAIIRCETKVGDTIECSADEFVQEVINFMCTELGLTGLEFSNEQHGSIVEDTIEFTIKAVLAQRKE